MAARQLEHPGVDRETAANFQRRIGERTRQRDERVANLAVDSDMNLSAAKATLAGTPPEPAAGAQPAPGADVAAKMEIGPGGDGAAISADRAKAGWAKAISAVNAGVTGVVQVR